MHPFDGVEYIRFRETEPGFMMRKGFLQIKTGIKLGLYVYF